MNTDQVLLEGLKVQSEKAIYEVYTSYYLPVEKHILLNSGSSEDAEDIFQDTVMVLLDYVLKENFQLTCTVKTLVFAIARRLWLKQLRYRSRKEILFEIEMHEADFLTHWEEVEKSEQKYDSIPMVLSRISKHCSGLLKELFLTGRIPDHYKNDHSFRNQKYKCLQQARKMIKKVTVA